MTYGELVSQIKSIVGKGVWSDDIRLSARHIIKIALRKRARVLKQEREKKSLQDRFSLQRIGCMELVNATKYECDCLPIKSTCDLVKRTKDKLPKPVKDYIHNVTTIDGSVVYSPADFVDYNQYKRLKPLVDKARYYISNEYIYVVDDLDKQYISVEALFEDPAEAAAIGCKDGEDDICPKPKDQEFAISSDLEDFVFTLTFEEITYMLKYGSEDQLNNASSDEVDLVALKKQVDRAKKLPQND